MRRQIEKDGVKIITGAKLQSAARQNGAKSLSLKSATSRRISCDAILVVGRAHARISKGSVSKQRESRYDARGVEVDARLRTSNARVFAAGDVCSRYQFTHAADAMARIVIANALLWRGAKRPIWSCPGAPIPIRKSPM